VNEYLESKNNIHEPKEDDFLVLNKQDPVLNRVEEAKSGLVFPKRDLNPNKAAVYSSIVIGIGRDVCGVFADFKGLSTAWNSFRSITVYQ
jgi:hypothetical protein